MYQQTGLYTEWPVEFTPQKFTWPVHWWCCWQGLKYCKKELFISNFAWISHVVYILMMSVTRWRHRWTQLNNRPSKKEARNEYYYELTLQSIDSDIRMYKTEKGFMQNRWWINGPKCLKVFSISHSVSCTVKVVSYRIFPTCKIIHWLEFQIFPYTNNQQPRICTSPYILNFWVVKSFS
jgi:hypothetical protein